MDNLTIFTEFLIYISPSLELHVLQCLLFLLIYLGALTGNPLTVTVIVTNPHLHSLIYFFIGNLSLIYVFCISFTVPKLIVNSLTGSTLISLPSCAALIFLFILFGSTELAFLVVMSCDYYVAICHPLHYGLTITPYLCTQAAGGSWASRLVYFAIHTGVMFRLPFTKSNTIYQYFCDVPQILRITSSYAQFCEFMYAAIRICIVLVCSAFLFKSHIDIFSMVLQMHSLKTSNKALSTCAPLLAIISLFVISSFTAVFSSTTNKPSLSNLLMAMFNNMLLPFTNSIIYSLWNRKINTALQRMFHTHVDFIDRAFLILKF